MKQIIGYMKYDYMNIKQSLGYMIIIFLFVVGMFSVKGSASIAVAYMMFGGLVVAGTTFCTTVQTVSFTALTPGRIWQKVCGRYLDNALTIAGFGAAGYLVAVVTYLAGLSALVISVGDFLILLGVSFIFLAIQNVLLYLLMPFLGIQYIGIVRMVPAFLMFFLTMNAAGDGNIGRIIQQLNLAVVLPITGILLLILSAVASCFIIRNRDNE